jgi:hypothetical protein
MACCCDLEDHEQDAPDDCTHCESENTEFDDGFLPGDADDFVTFSFPPNTRRKGLDDE